MNEQTTECHLIGECSAIELFVVRISRRPANSHTLIDIRTLCPSPLIAHATIDRRPSFENDSFLVIDSTVVLIAVFVFVLKF